MNNFPPLYKFSLKAEGGTNSVNRKCSPLRRSCVSSARNAGESAICPMRAQPSAEIVRVECAKCRRECDLSHARAICLNTLDLTLPTEHFTHNSHSNFTRGEKCFRASRRLVFFLGGRNNGA